MTKHTNSNDTDTNDARVPAGRRRALAMSAGVVIGSIGVVAGIGGGSASAIVDGSDTTVSANPWQVALTSPDGEQFCGGSIVSERVIVTAAHCTQGTPADQIQIRAGVTDLSTNDGQSHDVSAVIEHPKYVDGVGDIAMLVLATPLDLSNSVQPIELASASDVAAAKTARVTGWGVTDEQADGSPSVLQSTDVPLISDADCSLVDEGNDDELCAGGTGTDSCYGDSGGPLTVATENGQVLAGVVSWGEECGDDLGGVYAEVPTFASWVAERVDDPDAPAGERLPAPDNTFGEAEFEDGDFEDGDFLEIDDAFFDEYSDDELDAMTDDEFWDAVDPYLVDDSESGNEAIDDTTFDDANFDDMTFDDFDDNFDVEELDEFDGFDTNGDDIVQWSEFDDESSDFSDTNDDGIVNWSELIDA
ncbi:MAG: trypsin-like serine protease [Ilumatobacter sp.]